ncbi:MAG: 50S ribosomal protein L6 [Deltaproteobacteria bacterium]|nr:50S ribosomal protein L6 [Candidatus Anaeroferrophillus wilburensis]MBN2889535.1 50S ribosomal protein L6 [Deltaproteobacteria bacterium]
MSRIGKQPIPLAQGVEVQIQDGAVVVKGPKGELRQSLVERVQVAVEDNAVVVTRQSDDRRSRSFHGLMRALIANMVTGVSTGFTKTLELNGVGYRAEVSGDVLNMNLGFAHPINCPIPDGIAVSVEREKITVQGIDKQQVGAVAAKIRGYRPVEPYKGKGIKYANERVLRKAGKAGK